MRYPRRCRALPRGPADKRGTVTGAEWLPDEAIAAAGLRGTGGDLTLTKLMTRSSPVVQIAPGFINSCVLSVKLCFF